MPYHNTVFEQILKLIPLSQFRTLAVKHSRGQALRKTSRWAQFVTLSMAQLAGRSSLRDIVSNIAAQGKKLYHLGIMPISRSTLARVNEKQPYTLYENLFGILLSRCNQLAPKHGFRFKNKLYSLDASTIDLCLSMFPWANFRTTKGAVKLHLGLDHQGYLPAFATVTEGNISDITIGRTLKFTKGSIVVFDRGYTDYSWYYQLHQEGIYFVTRQKTNATFKVVERRPVNKSQGVTSDQTILIKGSKSEKCPIALRRIGYRDEMSGKQYVFLSNNFKLSARTIANIYKSRWQIELFFKWIKQNLKIKSFYGTSKNAVLTQIWIALCMYLMLAYIKFMNGIAQSLQRMIRLLQLNLFERRNLIDLLKGGPPEPLENTGQSQFKF